MRSLDSQRDLVPPEQMLNGEPRQLRDTLWIYLIRSQVEETATESKRASLMRRLTTIADAFDALIQYTQSLRVSCLAANRVFDTSQALLALRPASGCANRATDEDFLPCRAQVEIKIDISKTRPASFSLGPSVTKVRIVTWEENFPENPHPTVVQIQIETEKRMASLRELMERCTRNVVLPEGACTLLDHHADKRKDFLVASANLESLLENPRLSVSQMEKLRRQHNAILEDLRRSARLVNAELPRIVDLYVTCDRRVSRRTFVKMHDATQTVAVAPAGLPRVRGVVRRHG